MNEFTVFQYRDKDGNSTIQQIGDTDISDLRKWMGKHSKFEIALIWAIQNEEDDYREFQDFYNFQSNEQLQKEKDIFIRNYNSQIDEQKEAEKQYTAFKKDIKKSLAAFKKTNKITEFVPTKTNIIAEFDPDIIDLDPTAEIPLLKTPFWTKVWRQYENLDKIKNFFDQAASDQYLFQANDTKELGEIDMSHSTIEITVDPKDIENQVDFINSNLNANISNYKLFKINGSFILEKFYFDRNVLAMMLIQNRFYGNTLFLNEAGEVLNKKIKEKEEEGKDDQIKTVGRYTITWTRFGPEYSDPVFITFTNKEQDIIISIAKIPNENDITEAKDIALFLLDEYSKQEKTMIKIFKKGVAGFKLTTVKKQMVEKPKKTKVKLNMLRTYDPEVFLEHYPTLCTGSKQPRIATADEIAQGREGGENLEKLLEYPFGSGKFYTCDEGYPGIKINTSDKNAMHKYVPCCYPKPQQAKVAKLQAIDAGLAPKNVKEKIYIFDENKQLDVGRQGKLSPVLVEILKYHHLDPDIYVRYGVTDSSQSVIDAMAMIKGYAEWIADPEETRRQVIEELNGNILNSALQSYTRKYMERALKRNSGSETQLTAANFHPVLEYYFKAVVVVIKGSDLARPSSYFGFIPNLKKRKNLIILYQHTGVDEQVEVIGTYDKIFTIQKERAIVEFLKTKRQIYGFYSGTRYSMPRLSTVSSLATAQYVDAFGKCRGYLVGGQSVYTVPSAPSNKKVVTEPVAKKTKNVLKELNLKPLYFESGIVYTKGFVLPSDTLTWGDLPPPPKDYIMPYILTLSNFISTSFEAEKVANEILRGEKPVPAGKEFDTIRTLIAEKKIKQFPLETVDIVSPNVVVLYTKEDEENYIESLKTRPIFQWQKLWKLEYVPGKTHWIIVDDNKPIVIKDVEKPDLSKGLGWGVVEDAKLGDGTLIRYPEGKYAEILEIQ